MKFQHSLSAVALSVALLAGCQPQGDIQADKSPRPVKVITLEEAQNHQSLSFPAKLVPKQHAELSFRVPGTLANIEVEEGQLVTKGQPLMNLDPHDFEVQIAEYQARLIEAKAQARQARQERARVEQANQGNAIAKVELDRANTAVERAEASVTVVRQRLQMMQDALRYSALKAPFDAVVASVDIDTFEQVVPAISVMTLHGQDGYQVEFSLPNQLASQVTLGANAQLTIAGEPAPLSLTITEVARSASTLSRSFTVTGQLSQQPSNPWPEQSGNLTLKLPTQSQRGFLVPSSALQGDEKHAWVNVVADQVNHQVRVSVLGYEGQWIRVAGQLKTGDQVITAGAAYMKPGQPIGQIIADNLRPQL